MHRTLAFTSLQMQWAPNTLSFLPWWTAFPQTQSKQTTFEILSCFLLDVSILRPWTYTVSLGGRSFLGTTARVLFPISPISPHAPLGTLGRKMSEPTLASLVSKGDCLVTEWMGEGREAWEEDVTRVSPLFSLLPSANSPPSQECCQWWRGGVGHGQR